MELGKAAEAKIKAWLDRPNKGYCFDRINDQMTGFYGSSNICDFTLFKSPYMYYIESKATYHDRFDFNRITDYQRSHLLEKCKISNVIGCVIVLFATYKRAFIFNIQHIEDAEKSGIHSINIKYIDKWNLPYYEIPTISNSRKKLLDYSGDFVVPNYVEEGDNDEKMD